MTDSIGLTIVVIRDACAHSRLDRAPPLTMSRAQTMIRLGERRGNRSRLPNSPRLWRATMPALVVTPIATLKQFSDFLCSRIAAHPSPSWFRGCGCEDHKLLPSLYRHPTITQSESLLDLEMQLLERFRQRSVPFHDRDISDDWECLFFMQHFGVPTRLLDWSENPFIALFF